METGIAVKYMPTAEDIKRIKEFGYDAIDFSILSDTDTPLYCLEGEAFVAEVLKVRKIINDFGVKIHQTHGPWRYPPRDFTEEERSERFEKMTKAIEATKILGAKYLVIHPLMPDGEAKSPNPELFWEINRRFLTNLADVGSKNDVVVCFENMPFRNLTLSKPEDTLKMVKEINSPFLKICLDTGHSAVLGVSPAEAVRQIGKEYLAVLHIHDNDGKEDRHWIPYSGTIDWADFSNALREVEFDGVISMETEISKNFHLPSELKDNFEQRLADIARYISSAASK